MKNILVVLLFLSSLSLFGQDDEPLPKKTDQPPIAPVPKPSLEISGGLQIYVMKGKLLDPGLNAYGLVNSTLPIFNFMASVNIPMRKIRDELFIGLNPNIALGYSYGTFAGDIPLYATIKYGAASTKESTSEFGVGFGGGIVLSGFSAAFISNYSGYTFHYSTTYVAPSVMAEVSYATRYKGIYQIRGELTPVPVQKVGKFIGNLSQYNIRVIRTF